jgi:signal transduction histidine kinase
MAKEDVFKVFNSILEETERMGRLIKRLSPLTSSKNTTQRFNLITCLQDRVKAEQVLLQNSKIIVNLSPKQDIFLNGDSVKFEQLVSNLLLNAIDAINQNTKENSKQIDIHVKEKQKEIQIIFTDTGIGIPAKNRGKILDPFFTTKDPGQGEGFGLFIVWNILKMQGGEITLDPTYKSGARFIITIPKEVKPIKEV